MNLPDLTPKTNPLVTQGMAIVITDAATAQKAKSFSDDVRALIREVKDTFKPIKDATHAAHKSAVAAEKKHLDPLELVIRHIDAGLYTWQQEERRRIREAEEAARQKAMQEEEDRKLRDAELAAKAGFLKEADAILAQDTVVVLPKREEIPVKLDNRHMRESYEMEVYDLAAWIKYVAANPQYIATLAPVAGELKKLATTFKEAANFPGLRVRKITPLDKIA